MRRLLLSLLLVLLCSLQISAQTETPQYELHFPTPEEYIQATAALEEQIYTGESSPYLRQLLISEFFLRYSFDDLVDVSFAELTQFQETFVVGASLLDAIDLYQWFSVWLNVGLQEMPIEEFAEPFEVGYFELDSSSVDFDGDGVAEYLAEV